jgi:hypothetical protein
VERRQFLSSFIGTGIAAAAGVAAGASSQDRPAPAASPECYLWRQYVIRNGTQPRRLADFLQNAAIPALNRLGHKPVGVFEVVAGVPSPTVFVLTPLASADALTALAADPVYVRQEVSLLGAFPNVPRVEVPAATAAKGPRLFELRTYESHNERAHRAKMRMFTEMGEVDIFRRVGLTPVFFSRTLAGPRMPSLTYMLVHENMAGREKSWDGFRNDPAWKKLASTPGYSDAEIVSNITTVYLRPAAYSQI